MEEEKFDFELANSDLRALLQQREELIYKVMEKTYEIGQLQESIINNKQHEENEPNAL